MQWKSIFWRCVCSSRYPAQCAWIILPFVACPVLQFFFNIISQTTQSSIKKFIEHKIYVFIFCINFVWNNIHSKKNRARRYIYIYIYIYTGSSKKIDGIWNRYNLKSTCFHRLKPSKNCKQGYFYARWSSSPFQLLCDWRFKWKIPWCLDWKGWTNTLATSKPWSLSTWFFPVGVH